MKYLLIPLIALIGCTSAPSLRQQNQPYQIPEFPQTPTLLQTPCPALLKVPEGAELSTMVKIIVKNYEQYHLCAQTVDGWIDWYSTQKRLFEK